MPALPPGATTWNVRAIAALIGVLLMISTLAFYPFRWRTTPWVQNDVTRTADGFSFGDQNAARTESPPPWLAAAGGPAGLQVELQVQPGGTAREGLARILAISKDVNRANLVVAQSMDALVVRVRRPGSDAEGDPPIHVPGVLAPGRWVHITVTVDRHSVRVHVDGTERARLAVPEGAFGVWEADHHLALGSDTTHELPWRGSMRKATVTAGGEAVDYLRPGALLVPERFQAFEHTWEPPVPRSPMEVAVDIAHALEFFLVGALAVLARRPRPSLPFVVSASAATSASITVAKTLFEGRHASASDLVTHPVGALAGACLAALLLARRRGSPRAHPESTGAAHPQVRR